ncbi:MAG: YaiI/YqxD family protein [Ruthenibacterium sp.]
MKILVDADGCPVVDITVRIAKQHGIECLLLCDTAHVFAKEGARTLTVSKGADSVDFALVNLLQAGDVVVTQDYGLAAMCLARKAQALHQSGMEYTADNIDCLLLARHTAKKIRNAGGRVKGMAKRTSEQDADFEMALRRIVSELAPLKK